MVVVTMVYYSDHDILIRTMEPRDTRPITEAEIAQGWHQSEDKYLLRLKDQSEGKAVALVAECGSLPVGYINVYPNANAGPFAGQDLPEIVDFGVLEKYRRRGIGSRLMDVAEDIARRYADRVFLGVGLHQGYGSAQRLYVRRGYIPDGTGVWFHDAVCPPYSDCTNDDDLILYMVKSLK